MAATASSRPSSTLAETIEALGGARQVSRFRADRRPVERFPSRAALERVIGLLATALMLHHRLAHVLHGPPRLGIG